MTDSQQRNQTGRQRGSPAQRARRKALICVSGLVVAFSAPATAEWLHQHRSIDPAPAAAFAVPAPVLASPATATPSADDAVAGSAIRPDPTVVAKVAEAPALTRRPPLVLANSEDLLRKFAAEDIALEDVRHGRAPVPAIFLARFPEDLAALTSVKQRKQVFIKTMLPLVLRTNQQIAADRRLLLRLLPARQGALPAGALERELLVRLARRYGADPSDRVELLQRIDIVPPSLALAQGAEESGWGTSRFARMGNAVFGQRTFKGEGMVPQERPPGQRFAVRAFNALEASVRAYVWNLNTHPAYANFRAARAAMRAQGRTLDGDALAGALIRYSERGEAYVDTIRIIMRANRLDQFDDVRLDARDITADNRALPETVVASSPTRS